MEHLKEIAHTYISNICTPVLMWLKPSKKETIHGPRQHNILRQCINAKENRLHEHFSTIDHWKMTLHALLIEIMDQSGVKMQIKC